MKNLILVIIIMINSLGLFAQIDTTLNRMTRDTFPNERRGAIMNNDTMPPNRYGNRMSRDTNRNVRDGMSINRDTMRDRRTTGERYRDTVPNAKYGMDMNRDTMKNKNNSTGMNRDTMKNKNNSMGMNRDTMRNRRTTGERYRDTVPNPKYGMGMNRDTMKNKNNRMGNQMHHDTMKMRNNKGYNKDRSADMNMHSPYDAGVLKEDGKVFIIKNGIRTEVKSFTYLPHGIKVMSDGTLIKKDGNKVMMKDREFASRSTGEIVPMAKGNNN